MTVFLTIVIGAGCGGLGYLLRVVEDGWKAAGGVIDKAAADMCLYCRGYQWTADCTCPKRCTAMTCMAPAKEKAG